MNPLYYLLKGILSKFHNDPRIRIEKSISYGRPSNRYSIDQCPDGCRCKIVYERGWLDFKYLSECKGWCIRVFSDSLPPVKSFLQRRKLANVLIPSSNTVGCLYCFRALGRVTKVDTMCARCVRIHKQEGNELVKKKMIIEEMFGEDCAGVVLGFLLCFFAESHSHLPPEKENVLDKAIPQPTWAGKRLCVGSARGPCVC